MKKVFGKLSLHRETLHRLEPAVLARVPGNSLTLQIPFRTIDTCALCSEYDSCRPTGTGGSVTVCPITIAAANAN